MAERKYLKDRLELENATQKSLTRKIMDLNHELSKKDYQTNQLKNQLQTVKEQVNGFQKSVTEVFATFEALEKSTASLNDINAQLYHELTGLKYHSKNIHEEFTPRPNFHKICANLSVEGIES